MTDLIALAPPVTEPAPVKVAMNVSGPDAPTPPLSDPAGPEGGGNYLFRQTLPAVVWGPIAHGLGKYPSVTVQDTIGELTTALVEHLTVNELRIFFGAPCAGNAYLNAR